MTGPDRLLIILLFPFAFMGSLVLSELSFHLWPTLPNLLTVPVIVLIGLLGALLLLVVKRRSLLITLPVIWLVWVGITLPLLRQPSLVIEIESGCWPMDCGCTGACEPHQVPTTFTDIAIFAVIGWVIITISSLFASLVWFALWALVADWRTRGPEGGPPQRPFSKRSLRSLPQAPNAVPLPLGQRCDRTHDLYPWCAGFVRSNAICAGSIPVLAYRDRGDAAIKWWGAW